MDAETSHYIRTLVVFLIINGYFKLSKASWHDTLWNRVEFYFLNLIKPLYFFSATSVLSQTQSTHIIFPVIRARSTSYIKGSLGRVALSSDTMHSVLKCWFKLTIDIAGYVGLSQTVKTLLSIIILKGILKLFILHCFILFYFMVVKSLCIL